MNPTSRKDFSAVSISSSEPVTFLQTHGMVRHSATMGSAVFAETGFYIGLIHSGKHNVMVWSLSVRSAYSPRHTRQAHATWIANPAYISVLQSSGPTYLLLLYAFTSVCFPHLSAGLQLFSRRSWVPRSFLPPPVPEQVFLE